MCVYVYVFYHVVCVPVTRLSKMDKRSTGSRLARPRTIPALGRQIVNGLATGHVFIFEVSPISLSCKGVGCEATSSPCARVRVLLCLGQATCRFPVQVNLLLVGGGGREHALAWKLSQSPLCNALFCAPGNPGISDEPRVHVVPGLESKDHGSVVDFCKENNVKLVFVGPEAPLVGGLIDSLQAAAIPTFGPTKAAAQLEGSKVFMKARCDQPWL
jgi:hypothetical protein